MAQILGEELQNLYIRIHLPNFILTGTTKSAT
jgi:hypothetical protein